MEKAEFEVVGSKLLETVKKLIHEGNIRRIKIKQKDRVLIEIPLSIGVVGVVLAPALAAIGAIAALVAKCTIEVEKTKAKPKKTKKKRSRSAGKK